MTYEEAMREYIKSLGLSKWQEHILERFIYQYHKNPKGTALIARGCSRWDEYIILAQVFEGLPLRISEEEAKNENRSYRRRRS